MDDIVNQEDIQKLLEQIEAAFDQVPKGPMTIHEGEAKDDYRYATVEEERRERSRRWQEVEDRHLLECTCAMSYLDPISWRYYIPAYISWTLRNHDADENLVDSVVYQFGHLDSYLSRDHYESLNKAQAKAVYQFQQLMNVPYPGYVKPEVLRYWKSLSQ